ncbi:MAG: hypothetical protein ACRCSK_02605 [Fusobacteriaceae bacterium]
MRKILLGLIAISFITFGAETKKAPDLKKSPAAKKVEAKADEAIEYEEEEIVTYAKGIHLAIKGSFDIYGKYTPVTADNGTKLSTGETNSDGYYGNLEIQNTYNIHPYVEVGFGIDLWQNHLNQNTVTLPNGSKKAMPSFDSFPVYAEVRYIIGDFGNFSPYIEGYFGYSFNIVFDKIAVETTGNNSANITYYDNYDVADGLFYGLGLGTEYKNWLFCVSYKVNTADITLKANSESKTFSMDYSAIALNFGYKFSF